MTGNVTSDRAVPYWNEIKDLSWEDRHNLAELLEVSLVNDSDKAIAEDFVREMPVEALEMASEYALRESRAGRCIPHQQAMDWIKEKRGWK